MYWGIKFKESYIAIISDSLGQGWKHGSPWAKLFLQMFCLTGMVLKKLNELLTFINQKTLFLKIIFLHYLKESKGLANCACIPLSYFPFRQSIPILIY